MSSIDHTPVDSISDSPKRHLSMKRRNVSSSSTFPNKSFTLTAGKGLSTRGTRGGLTGPLADDDSTATDEAARVGVVRRNGGVASDPLLSDRESTSLDPELLSESVCRNTPRGGRAVPLDDVDD